MEIQPDQIIEDINWIAANPSLVSTNVFEEPIIEPLSAVQKQRIQQANYFLKSKKLGAYFELLIKTYINVNEKYILRASNLQVLKEKQTVGEFDFIVELLGNHSEIEHWEISCKFYLCFNPSLGLMGCSGTQRKDVFQHKISRMKNHQLVLGASEFGLNRLKPLGISNPKPLGLLKGMVFYHKSLGVFEDAQINSFHRKEVWMYFSECSSGFERNYIVLKKPFLFSLNSYGNSDWISGDEVVDRVKKESQPFMLAEVDENTFTEKLRYWMIPDGWFENLQP